MTVGRFDSASAERRDELLARIRAELGRDGGHAKPEPPTLPDLLIRTASANSAELFAVRARSVGMSVVLTKRASLAACIGEQLRSVAANRVAMSGECSAWPDVVEAMRRAGITIIDPASSSGVAAMYDADVGITGVVAGIAETGSLIVESGPTEPRGTSLVPPVHFAILNASDIVADLVDCVALVGRRLVTMRPSNTVLITGPSKTADIEGVLVTGVHGPREVRIVVLSDV